MKYVHRGVNGCEAVPESVGLWDFPLFSIYLYYQIFLQCARIFYKNDYFNNENAHANKTRNNICSQEETLKVARAGRAHTNARETEDYAAGTSRRSAECWQPMRKALAPQ